MGQIDINSNSCQCVGQRSVNMKKSGCKFSTNKKSLLKKTLIKQLNKQIKWIGAQKGSFKFVISETRDKWHNFIIFPKKKIMKPQDRKINGREKFHR